jgi:hypothetical protein
MATGDQSDIAGRLFRWLPTRWFPSGPGTLIYATLAGWAGAFAAVYSNIATAALQMRIASATFMLEIVTIDYFGSRLPRLAGESDPAFSMRLRREILRERVTREAIDRIVFDTTGNHPQIIELNRVSDIGALRQGFALGSSRLGSYQLPFQVFIIVPLANANAGPPIAGLRSGYAGLRSGFFPLRLPGSLPPPNPAAAVVDTALESVRPSGITYWRRYL